jgi:hypothetical protein
LMREYPLGAHGSTSVPFLESFDRSISWKDSCAAFCKRN